MMNLMIMILNLALKVEAPSKPTVESSTKEKKSYEDCEYSNSCCLMIMENHMEDSIYESILKTKNAKEFLDAVGKKYTKFLKNEKNELLNTLHSTFYDGTSGVRGHISKILVCYNKIKTIGMKFDSYYVVWLIMGTLPLQFHNIRSSYNAQNDQWTIEEMTVILSKEGEDMKKRRSKSISMLTTQDSGGQKRKFLIIQLPMRRSMLRSRILLPRVMARMCLLFPMPPRMRAFKGKCNYCLKFGHKKTNCRKLKAF